MNNGIKPTRLWRLTGKCHHQSMLKDRYCAVPPYTQRDRKDFLQLLAITLASTLGIASTFGAFSKQKTATTIIRGSCDPGAKAKCSPPKEPCPPKKDPPMKPCACDD